MSYQSPRRWMRLTLVALFALTLLGTFPVATRAASTPAATAHTAASTQLTQAKRVPPDATIQSRRYICGNTVTMRWSKAGAEIPGAVLTWYDAFDEYGRDGAWSVGYSPRLGVTGWIITQYLC
jgi:hypothetical protein